MKHLLPLLALTLFITACSSHEAPRRQLWTSAETGGSQAESGSAPRKVWGPDRSTRYSGPASDSSRRDLYSPAAASGPYTDQLKNESWKRGALPADEERAQRLEQAEIQKMQAPPTAKP